MTQKVGAKSVWSDKLKIEIWEAQRGIQKYLFKVSSLSCLFVLIQQEKTKGYKWAWEQIAKTEAFWLKERLGGNTWC